VADRGHQHFRFALYPHAGDWKQAMTVRHGFAYNYPLQAVQVESHTGSLPQRHSFVSVKAENVVLTAMKKAEDTNGLVFHLYEWAGKSGEVAISVPPGASSAVETNLLEQSVGENLPIQGDIVRIPVKPFEIVAVKVNYSASNPN
jgi:alpha-mannosidase